MTSPDLLCMGCMAVRGSVPVCPDCGWREGTLPDSPLQLAPRTLLNNTYLLGRVLGQGGFGVTYLAWDLEEDDKRAVKEYLPSALATRSKDGRTVAPSSGQNREPFTFGLKKFNEEAETLKRFAGHPNIVGVRDFFQGNGTAYIVMNYVEGITLKQYLEDKGGKIPFETAVKILLPVMDALREVHEAGILHRDISPDNIYLCYSGPVKLLDFGATKQAIGEHSQSMAAIFKPGYTPQEQYLSQGKQGPWTDVYALAATLYRSITGQTPQIAWERLERDNLKPPSRLGVTIPTQSEAALMQALAVRPESRLRSVSQFQTGVVRGSPISDSQPRSRLQPRVREVIRLSKTFFLTSYAVGGGLCAVVAIALNIRQLNGVRMLSPNWLIVGSVSLLFSSSVMLALIYKMWLAIQNGTVQRSPAEAVALLFVPFYGIFQSVWGFAKDYNAYIFRHSLRIPKLPEGLFLAYAILCCIMWIPGLGIPLIAANYFIGCIMVSYICDAVNALPQEATPKPGTKRLQLYCIFGEFKGNDFEVPPEGVIIGRSLHANLILKSDLVSGRHVRVWPDPAGSGLWLEDLKSTNGTSYCERAQDNRKQEWPPLVGRKLLAKGGRLRLEPNVAEFELRET